MARTAGLPVMLIVVTSSCISLTEPGGPEDRGTLLMQMGAVRDLAAIPGTRSVLVREDSPDCRVFTLDVDSRRLAMLDRCQPPDTLWYPGLALAMDTRTAYSNGVLTAGCDSIVFLFW